MGACARKGNSNSARIRSLSGDAFDRLRVTAADRDVAGGTGQLPILVHRLRGIGALDPREIPIDLQPVARLLRGPELVGDDGDRRALAPGGIWKTSTHARDAARGAVVHGLRPAAEDGRMRHQRHLHARQVEVEPELLRAVAFRAAVEPADMLADQPELATASSARRSPGPARARRRCASSAYRGGLSGRAMDDAGLRAASVRRDLPSLRGRGHEHGAGPRAQLAVLLERSGDRSRAADHLDAAARDPGRRRPPAQARRRPATSRHPSRRPAAAARPYGRPGRTRAG